MKNAFKRVRNIYTQYNIHWVLQDYIDNRKQRTLTLSNIICETDEYTYQENCLQRICKMKTKN